jgi:hypothetical protein
MAGQYIGLQNLGHYQIVGKKFRYSFGSVPTNTFFSCKV